MKKIIAVITLLTFTNAFADVLFYKFSRSSGMTPPQYRYEKSCTVHHNKVEIKITDANGEHEVVRKINMDPQWHQLIILASSGKIIPNEVPADFDPSEYLLVQKLSNGEDQNILLLGNDDEGNGAINDSAATDKLIVIIDDLCN